jgi:hypothetical protein
MSVCSLNCSRAATSDGADVSVRRGCFDCSAYSMLECAASLSPRAIRYHDQLGSADQRGDTASS